MIDQVMQPSTGTAIKGFKLGALFSDARNPRPLGSDVSLSHPVSSVTQAGKVRRWMRRREDCRPSHLLQRMQRGSTRTARNLGSGDPISIEIHRTLRPSTVKNMPITAA